MSALKSDVLSSILPNGKFLSFFTTFDAEYYSSVRLLLFTHAGHYPPLHPIHIFEVELSVACGGAFLFFMLFMGKVALCKGGFTGFLCIVYFLIFKRNSPGLAPRDVDNQHIFCYTYKHGSFFWVALRL